MISQISTKIAAYFVETDAIKQEEQDSYVYAITKIIGTALSVCGALLLALPLGRALEALVYIVSFLTLRGCSGGYHSRSKLLCFAVFEAILALHILVLSPLLSLLPLLAKLLLAAVSGTGLLLFAPVNHPDFDASRAEWEAMRKRMCTVLLAEAAVCLVLYTAVPFPLAGDYIILSMCSVFALVLVAKLLKQEVDSGWGIHQKKW